jgi:phosphoribosylanthranilate isomerase
VQQAFALHNRVESHQFAGPTTEDRHQLATIARNRSKPAGVRTDAGPARGHTSTVPASGRAFGATAETERTVINAAMRRQQGGLCPIPAPRPDRRCGRNVDLPHREHLAKVDFMTRVKICGVTSVKDAVMCAEAGADAIGLNFAARSPRRVDLDTARSIASALPDHIVKVGVFVDASESELRATIDVVGLGCVQLHGAESPELVAAFLPHAYKAIRVRGRGSLDHVAQYPGEHILLDAYVPGVAGGTGTTFDWELAAEIAQSRRVTLAGGLKPGNVAEAVRAVRPYCVDIASGVESAPGRKDPAKVRALITAAKGA